MRRRLSIAPADSEWLPEQLPQRWPYNIEEGEWRSVGPRTPGAAQHATMSRLARNEGRAGSARGPGPTGGSPFASSASTGRFAPAEGGEATSPAGGGMNLFNR